MTTDRQREDDARVLDALHRMGRAGGYELRNELGIRSYRVFTALSRLLDAGLIEDQRETPEPVGRPARRMYVPSAVEEER